MDSTLRIWDMDKGECIQTLTIPPVEAWTARFHPNGEIIATGSYDGHINLYNIQSGEKVESLTTKHSFIMCTAFVSDKN